MNKKLKEWFTDERRQAIQMFGVVIATLLVTTGTITHEQTQHVFTIVALAIQLFAGIVSLVNLTVHDAASWFLTVGRGAIYAAAPIAAAAGVGLGLIREDAVPNILTWVSLALTAVAAVVAILFNKNPAETR